MPFHDKRVALVTGGNRGIGYAISRSIAQRGITVILGVRDRNDNLLVNSACPGWVRTDMGGDQAPLTPEQSADTPVWLATLPDGGPTGGFYRDRTRIPGNMRFTRGSFRNDTLANFRVAKPISMAIIKSENSLGNVCVGPLRSL